MKVLELVEEGKVTVEEATKLLDALSAGITAFDNYEIDEGLEERLHDFSRSVNSFVKDIGDKLNTTYKDVEPKLKTATRAIVEKTATIADEVSRTLRENLKATDEKKDDESNPSDDAPKEN
jgi:polyhydroxyalkanoate synthesis regulator phasin